MALLTELIPVITFFVAYQLTDLYIATVATMVVSILQLLISWIKKEPIPMERWINASVLVGLGSITLISKNSQFIKWKPTIGYSVLATTLAIAPYRNNVTLLQASFGKQIPLSKELWEQLNRVWISFFCGMGLLNLIVAFNTSTKVWIYFKLFGVFGLTGLFIIGQITYLIYFKKLNLYALTQRQSG